MGTQTTPRDLDDRLKAFWDLETLGIKKDECSVYEDFERSISFRDGRYKVHLPWKEPHPELADNYKLSQRRLDGLLKRLRQNPPVLHKYDKVIKDQLNRGIVEIVNQPEIASGQEVHYLPHHITLWSGRTRLQPSYE